MRSVMWKNVVNLIERGKKKREKPGAQSLAESRNLESRNCCEI